MPDTAPIAPAMDASDTGPWNWPPQGQSNVPSVQGGFEAPKEPEPQEPLASAPEQDFQITDIPKLVQEPDFKNSTPDKQEDMFDHLVGSVTSQHAQDFTPQQWQDYNKMVDANRQSFSPSTASSVLHGAGETVSSLGKTIAAGVGSVAPGLQHPIEMGKTVASSAAYDVGSAGNNIYHFVSRHIPGTHGYELDKKMAEIRSRIDSGELLGSPSKQAKQIKQWSKDLLPLQQQGNLLAEQRHKLTKPENALLLSHYIHTHNPKYWEALRRDVTSSSGDDFARQYHTDISESNGAKAFDAWYGKGSHEHLIGASDPMNLLFFMRAAKTASAISKVAKAANFTGEMAGFGVLNAIRNDPASSMSDIGEEALKSILAGTILHFGAKGVKSLLAKKKISPEGQSAPETTEPPTTQSDEIRQPSTEEMGAHPNGRESTGSENGSTSGPSDQGEAPAGTGEEAKVAPPAAPQPGDTIAHADTDARAVAAGFEIPERGTRWTEAGATAEAADRMKDSTYATRLVQFLLQNPEVRIDPVNAIVLGEHLGRLADEFERQREELKRRPDPAGSARLSELEQSYRDALEVTTKAGSQAGSEMRARQIARAKAALESLPSILSTMEAKNGGPLDAETRAQVEKDFDEKKAAEAASAAAQKAAEDNKTAEVTPPVTESVKRSRKASKQQFLDALSKAAEDARKRLRGETGGTVMATIDPLGLTNYAIIGADYIARGVVKTAELGAALIKEFGEAIKPHINEIIAASRAYHEKAKTDWKESATTAKEGLLANASVGTPEELNALAAQVARAHVYADPSLTGEQPEHAKELISRVRADLAKVGQNLSESETARAITGYGPKPAPKRTAAQKRLSELKAQILAQEKLEDAQKGILPWIRRTFAPQSDPVRRKLTELRDEVRKITDKEVEAGRMKSGQHKREKQLENQIADIEAQIAAPGHKGRSPLSPLPETARSKELTARRDALRAHLNDLRAEEVRKEQVRRRVGALRERLNDLLSRLATGDREHPEAPKAEDSPEIRTLKGQIASVQREMRAEDRTMTPSPTQEELYNQRRIKAAKASEAHYKELLARKQFNRQLPKTHPLNQEAQQAVDAAKEAKDAFEQAAEDSGARAEQRLQSTLERLRDRVAQINSILEGGQPKSGPTRQEPKSPEYSALKNERDRLNKVLSNQRLAKAKSAREAADAAARAMDEQIATLDRITADARKRRRPLVRQEAELQELRESRGWVDAPALERYKKLRQARIARDEAAAREVQKTGRVPVKKSRRQIELDDRVRELEVQAVRANNKLKATISAVEYRNLPPWARGLRRLSDFFREAAISGYHTAGKLAGFASLRQFDTAAKEMSGLLLSRLPYFRELMQDARFESAGGTFAEDAKARGNYLLTLVKTEFSKGLRQGFQQLRTGEHNERTLYDKPHLQPQGIESRILSRIGGGSLHAAIKAPIIIGTHEANLARMESLGKSTGGEIPKQSYGYAKRQALQEENAFAAWFKQGVRQMEGPDKLNGRVSPTKAMLAAFGKIFLTKDIIKTPSNWIAQIWEGLSGLPRSFGRTRSAFKRGLQNMPIQERETTSRLAKAGTVGVTMLAWGFLDSFRPPSKRVFGGFYEPGHRDEKDPAFGAMRLWGTSNSHWWAIMTHNPFAAIGQIGSTVGRAYQTALKKGDSQAIAVSEGMVKSMLGLMETSPVGGSVMRLSQHHDAKSLIGDELRSLIPASVVNYAEDQDTAKGRVRKTVGDQIQYGIPKGLGLPNRQQLPVKRTH